MGRRYAWVLNFDAEIELASPVGYRTPSAAMRARMLALEARVTADLLGPNDVIVRDGARVDREVVGRAWCPTSWALEEKLGHALDFIGR